jgi:hypothetical protein
MDLVPLGSIQAGTQEFLRKSESNFDVRSIILAGNHKPNDVLPLIMHST